ncbi:MAG: thiamine pyrophosphate-dependent enzyme [Thermoleophilaceae bacterium]
MKPLTDSAAVAPGVFGIVEPDGSPAGAVDPPLSDEETIEALRWMRLSRAVDERALSLQRQGKLGTFPPVHGQEAAVVGTAMALDPSRDWIVPQYRELPAMLRHGYPLERYLLALKGDPLGSAIPEDVRVLPMQIALAAQLPHAAGLAWGLRRRGLDGVVMAYIGEGACSEGDFHEACNLAGVMRAPLVVVVQNNGWAISTPRERQSAGDTIACRAQGYGFAGVVADGNDVQATYHCAQEAVARCRDGGGPTILELMTYRMGPHTTADDPSRYVDAEVLDEWRRQDPIERAVAYLAARGGFDDEAEREMAEWVDATVDEAWAQASARSAPGPERIFEQVYASEPARLAAQRASAIGRAED